MDWERLKPTNLFEGASWHGRDIGSNGVGTCLAIAEPVILIGPEHFQEGYVGWTCIGAPIRDASRTVVGALGFSIPNEHAHVHAWGWALSVAQGVEANLQRDEPTNAHEIRRIAESARMPLRSVSAVFDLLATKLGVSPSHEDFLEEGRAKLQEAEAGWDGQIQELRAALREWDRGRRPASRIRLLLAGRPVG